MHIAPIWAMDKGRSLPSRASHGGQWRDRRWMNTPGPIYTGKSDFVLMGPTIASNFVALDDEQVDVVFRQPVTEADLGEVLQAADSDPFGGYACDGNTHWTIGDVREWWHRVPEIRRHIEDHLLNDTWYQHPSEVPMLRRIGQAWAAFLDTDAEPYARTYCHFLETGK